MRSVEKTGFLWPFVGGFLIGAVALGSLQPATAAQALAEIRAMAAQPKG